MKIVYGVFESKYGSCMVAFWDEKIVFLGFLNEEDLISQELSKLSRKYLDASFERNDMRIGEIGDSVFEYGKYNIFTQGTDFQKKVWNQLKLLKDNETITYSELAKRCGNLKAVRAVATAVGKNDISILIPCHRIVRKDGPIGQYRWGSDVKERILKSERE